MANENGWGDGAVNNNIGWGQGAVNNNISWGKSHIDSWSGATDIDGGNAPINTVAPVISGSTSLGSVLTTTNGTWTSLTAITYTYQWYRGATLITGATNSTYTIVVADSAANITCQVTATNSLGSANATSNTITAQTFSAPINTVAPAITGTAQEGQTLTCSTGTWTGNPTPTYTYQWKRNNSNIGSATNSTYTLVTADVGQSIKCTVTATNSISAVNADSNTVVPIAATPSIITTNLLSHLDAGNAASYPGTGTTWTDLTGNAYNGTLNGGVTYSSSNGGILIYDGIDDNVTIPLSKNALANVTGKWTIQFWVYISGSQSVVGIFQMADVFSSASPWLYLQRQNNNTIRWYVGGGYQITQTINTNTWYNLAISYDQTTVRFYTNGVQEATTYGGPLGANTASTTFLANGYGGYVNGRMPHILAYTTNLSAAQILQNYNALKPRY